MEPTTRLELVTPSLPRTCSTTELRGPTNRSESLERETGLEPATNGLEGRDSTTELLPHRWRPFEKDNGAGGWVRTTVGIRQQIYSLPPLTTRPRLRIDYFLSWSWRWDSNPQPADYKSAALPLSYASTRSIPDSTLALKEHTSTSRRGNGTVTQARRRYKGHSGDKLLVPSSVVARLKRNTNRDGERS